MDWIVNPITGFLEIYKVGFMLDYRRRVLRWIFRRDVWLM